MEISSDDAENSNDSFKNLPPVNIQSSCSASSSNSSSQSSTKISKTKEKNTDDRNNELASKKTSKSVKRNAQNEKLAEKVERKRAKELNKIYKPGECMKYMKIEMHPTFLSKWYAGDVEREVGQAGAKIAPSPALFDTGLVLWKRCVPLKLISNQGQVEMSPSEERCGHGLCVMTASDAVPHILRRGLAGHVRQVSEAADAKLTLVVFGAEDYFKSAPKRTKENKNEVITEMDLEMAITDLLVSTGCDTVLVNQGNELALLIVQSTKAIAEAPYKRSRHEFDDQVDFYMRGDNKKCVAVDKDGNGLSNLWQQMISVLPLCSLETSRALCSNYKTPLALYETLLSVDGVQTIANLGVTRSAVPGSRARRIGPEFARKLHTLFTAEDENTVIE
ncbi:unnamed protein product, partial [Iphiclides podalirius]